MPSGVSSVGWQTVLSGQPSTDRYLYADVGNNLALTPKRVGFYYVFADLGVPVRSRPLLFRDAVYEPGFFEKLVIADLSATDKIRVIVNWNQSGLPWYFDIF